MVPWRKIVRGIAWAGLVGASLDIASRAAKEVDLDKILRKLSLHEEKYSAVQEKAPVQEVLPVAPVAAEPKKLDYITVLFAKLGKKEDIKPLIEELERAEREGNPYRSVMVEGSLLDSDAAKKNDVLFRFAAKSKFSKDRESDKRTLEDELGIQDQPFKDALTELFLVAAEHNAVPCFAEIYNSYGFNEFHRLNAKVAEADRLLRQPGDKEVYAENYCDSMAAVIAFRNSRLRGIETMAQSNERAILFVGGAHRNMVEGLEQRGLRVVEGATPEGLQGIFVSVLIKKSGDPMYRATPEEREALVQALIDKNYRREKK